VLLPPGLGGAAGVLVPGQRAAVGPAGRPEPAAQQRRCAGLMLDFKHILLRLPVPWVPAAAAGADCGECGARKRPGR
jgi:hypothetical protein